MGTQETGKTLKVTALHHWGNGDCKKRILQMEVTWDPSVTVAFALIPLPILVNFIP